MKAFQKINMTVVVGSLISMALLVFYIVAKPESSVENIVAIRDFITQSFGFLFLAMTLSVLIFLLWLATSKYGNIRFGEGKPEHSFSSWFAMIFCAGMSSSVLYWGSLEWSYYYSSTPLGAEPYSSLAAELSTPYALFHWGIGPWAIYMIGAIAMAYAYYNKKMKNGLTMSAMCSGCIGEKASRGFVGKILDWLLIFGLLGGFIPTVTLAVPFIANGFSKLVGIEEIFIVNLAFVIIIAAGFTFTSYLGIDKGMKNLSSINAKLAFGIVIYIFITGSVFFTLNNTLNAFGIMANDFIRMSTWTDPINNSGFPQGWTMFYYAWFLATATLIWVFAAKLSRGRTVKQVTFGLLFGCPIGTWFIFSILTGNALNKQLTGKYDFVGVLKQTSPANAINTLVQDFTPFGTVLLVLWVVVCCFFVMSSMDGCTFTLAATSAKNLKSDEEPSKMSRLFWSLILSLVPLGLMFINAPLEAIQAFAVITALPLLATVAMACVSIVKWFKEDFGHMNKDEIKEKFKIKE